MAGPGTTESHLAGCAEFATELDARLVPASWLLPPRPRDGRHLPDAPMISWLRRRIGVGDALVLHGYDHTADPIGRWATSAVVKIGRRAEFAVLPSHEATLRLIAATRTMDELGLRSDVFAPPRWLASAGTVVALRRRGFRVCADSAGVRLLDQHAAQDRVVRGRVLSTGGVLASAGVLGTTGVGSPDTEAWRHRSLVAAAARTGRRGGLVRISADAAELSRPTARKALLDAVDAALSVGARPGTYRVPLAASAPLSA